MTDINKKSEIYKGKVISKEVQYKANVSASNGRPAEFDLPIAKADELGAVMIGNNLQITEEGLLSADTYSKSELDNLLNDKADLNSIPQNVSELTNDENYVTQSSLNQQFSERIVPMSPATSSNLGGVKIGNGINAESDGTISVSSRNIGEIVVSTIPLADSGLHLLDGALIDGNGIYSGFVDYISGLDLTANYFCTESEWQASVAQYGVCGKFVYNSISNAVRLPKLTGIIEGTADVNALGDLVEAGLPNITGSTGCWKRYQTVSDNGALYRTNEATEYPNESGTGRTNMVYSGIGIDASLSSSVYGNSTTVQPQTIKYFYYIVVANSTKNDIQTDIDEIATDLNGKADSDLSNLSNSGQAKFDSKASVDLDNISSVGMQALVDLCMPDYSAPISMGFPSQPLSTTTTIFVCPSAGWIVLIAYKTTVGNSLYLRVNGSLVGQFVGYSANGATMYAPVSKGDIITIITDSTSTTWIIAEQLFYPLKGAS